MTAAEYTYWDYIANAASLADFHRPHDEVSDPARAALISTESLPENNSMIDFKAFAHDYPEKLFPLLMKLRPEFQELFVEYYLLCKSQSFIGRVHGFIQTRVWQALRLVEQAIGAFIILGSEPNAATLRPIIEKSGQEVTGCGSLTDMIILYAACQNFATVAKTFGVPVPAIRKIFRPAVAALLSDKNIKAVAVGAYLRNLTHRASLTGAGLSKRCIARTRRMKTLKFTAPPSEESPLISFGPVQTLQDTPWNLLEISSDHRMAQLFPALRAQGKRLFGKKPAQIFAPVGEDGELVYGYIFARSISHTVVRGLTKIRGISEMSATCNAEGSFVRAVTIPHADVAVMIARYKSADPPKVRLHDFVEILTGDAARYCGTVTKINKSTNKITVEVSLPTRRRFIVTADPTCVRILPRVPAEQRTFWGVLIT